GEMQLMRRFWDAAVALDPDALELDEGRRFPSARPAPLVELFESAGVTDVRVLAIDVPTVFKDFDDYWSPFLGGQAPAPGYCMSLSEERRAALRERIPSNALLHVAALIEDAERARELGVDFGEPRVSLDPLRKWKSERVVGRLARGLAAVAKARGVEVIGGRAVFESSRALRVEGDEPQKVRLKHAIVAT